MNFRLRLRAVKKSLQTPLISVQAYVIWTTFCGIVFLGGPSLDWRIRLFTTTTWVLSNLWAGVQLGVAYQRYIVSKEYGQYRKYFNPKKNSSNDIIPILCHMGPRDMSNTVGQCIYNSEKKTNVNLISLPAVISGCKNDDEIIFRYMLTIEHEVFHGISHKYGLHLTEENIDWLKEKFIGVTGRGFGMDEHWSYRYSHPEKWSDNPEKYQEQILRVIRYEELTESLVGSTY